MELIVDLVSVPFAVGLIRQKEFCKSDDGNKNLFGE
jgi:hypothetical protein